VQQFTSETPEQTMPESWLWVKNLEQPHCREQIFGVNEQAVQPWWFVPLSQGRIRANVRRGEIHKVVARSPDLATSPTEGLQPRPRRETCGPADGGVWRPAPNSASGSGYHAILREAEGLTDPLLERVAEVQSAADRAARHDPESGRAWRYRQNRSRRANPPLVREAARVRNPHR